MKKSQKFYHSRIHTNRNKLVIYKTSQEDSSLAALENPTYIVDQLSKFQQKLPSNHHGFCGVTRQHSLHLNNTEGYRKYVKNKKNNPSSLQMNEQRQGQRKQVKQIKQVKQTKQTKQVQNNSESEFTNKKEQNQ